MQTQSSTVLSGYSDQEKGAYLGALASLATADRQASAEEVSHIKEMIHMADISPQQEQAVLHAANDMSESELRRCLDTLKGSDLRFSLITDLIALAKADESYTEDEKRSIEKISQYLNVNKEQFGLLDQFVDKASDTTKSPEEISRPGFLDSLGLRDKFSNAGFSMPSMKSLMGFLGPMILGGMAAKALGKRSGGGVLGGALGGMLGGNLGGSAFGSGGMGMGLPGGLGSIISGINKSRNNQSIGGLLSKLL